MENYEFKLLREKEIRKIKSHIWLESIFWLLNKGNTFIDTFYLSKNIQLKYKFTKL